ncbi:ATP-grasp domain-containing protein [Runella sp.]|uniref:ATP-grasp domain-containing protein n=1 Tax=Runella sp. TaxID=1960881 RepID=UPI003D0F14E8
MVPQNILLLGARAPIALEMARSFGKQGHRVILADSLHLTLARWSKYVSAYYHLPPPAYAFEDFQKKLIQIIIDEKIDHCLPTCEEAFFVSMTKDSLPCEVWTADMDLMHQLHRKDTFIELAKGFLEAPDTINAADFEDFDNTSSYVFKPIYSRFANFTLIRPTVSQIKKIPDLSTWVCQRFISGKEVCVYSIWAHGKLKGITVYHPRYRVGQGSGIYFEPVNNDMLIESVTRFGKAIDYHGQLSFDFIIQPDSTPVVLECNPRGISGAHLIGDDLARCFLDDSFQFLNIRDYHMAVKFAFLITQPHRMFKSDFYRAKDVIFNGDDPLPLFLQPLSLVELLKIKFLQKKTLLQASTQDIEWNG